MLGKVLVAPPDRVAREALSGLRGDDSPLGQALNALAAQFDAPAAEGEIVTADDVE